MATSVTLCIKQLQHKTLHIFVP